MLVSFELSQTLGQLLVSYVFTNRFPVVIMPIMIYWACTALSKVLGTNDKELV